MRTLSFILGLMIAFTAPSVAGSSEGALPGIGAFAYTGSPVVLTAPASVTVASR